MLSKNRYSSGGTSPLGYSQEKIRPKQSMWSHSSSARDNRYAGHSTMAPIPRIRAMKNGKTSSLFAQTNSSPNLFPWAASTLKRAKILSELFWVRISTQCLTMSIRDTPKEPSSTNYSLSSRQCSQKQIHNIKDTCLINPCRSSTTGAE